MQKFKKIWKEHKIEIIVVIILVITMFISIFTQDGQKGAWWWNLLNNINIIVGFVTAIIAYLTWRATRILRGNFEKEIRIAQNRDSSDAVAIAIQCGTNAIEENVKKFLENAGEDKATYANLISESENNKLMYADEFSKKYEKEDEFGVRVKTEGHFIYFKIGDMPIDDSLGLFMRSYSTTLEDICGLCKANDISNIYLFIQAPMPVAFLAGEKFSNKFLVHTHHYIYKENKYVMTTCHGFREYIDQDKLFDFVDIK